EFLGIEFNLSISNIVFALLLSLIAGLSTGIGSIIAYFIKKPKLSYLSLLLSFSAGVMLYISFAEILAKSVLDIGFIASNLSFFLGIGCILLIDILVPHAYAEETECSLPELLQEPPEKYIPASNSQPLQKIQHQKGHGHQHRHGHQHQIQEQLICQEDRNCLMRTGMFVALGIAIHNFPEGIATFSSGISGDPSLYIIITFAIAIHNIPEGISVSIPIYYATGSKRRGIYYSMLSGLAEPLGAIIALIVLLPFISVLLMSSILAFVAGVMVFISLDELLPAAHKFGQEHIVLAGLILGMAVMVVSLIILP
ncbi:MAG: zinc transporter ZupT, partial [Candidatus Hodarchaeota archaeon]